MRTRIGLEIHAQLLTQTKLFCACSARYFGAPPNTLTCPVCLGMPGALPVLNRRAVELAIQVGLALGCEIAVVVAFDRKNYFYPDLPKGYQISQYERPIAQRGSLEITSAGRRTRVRIRRVHLEEDAGKLLHTEDGKTLVDFNRSGVPLVEVVTEPDLATPAEARLFVEELRRILRYLGACTGDMEEGALRCDANLSVSEGEALGRKTEVKNLNSFRAIERALCFEEERQRRLLARGEKVEEVTLGWDERRGEAFPMRSKEEADDYRYFPEPDLPPLAIDRGWVERLREGIPELPQAKRARFLSQYALQEEEAGVLADERALADYYERVAALSGDAKQAAGWILSEVLRLVKGRGEGLAEIPLSAEDLAALVGAVRAGRITRTSGKEVLEEAFHTGRPPEEIIASRGLSRIGEDEALLRVARSVVAANPQAVADWRAGRTQVIGFLVGQVMKETHGRADPKRVAALIQGIVEGA